MSKRVFVSGIGIISGIGKGIEQSLESIYSLKPGIGEISYINTIHKGDIPVSEVKYSNTELKELAGISDKKYLGRTSLMGIIAATEAVKDAGIDVKEMPCGFISATSVGGMDRSEIFYKDFVHDNNKGRLRDIFTHDCGDHSERIADYIGIRDFVSTISTACSSSANSIMFGARMIKNGMADRMVVGGSDSLTAFTINGFNTLMILDRNACRPFDNTRQGLNLGEGSAFLVLESEEAIKKYDKEVYCELTGYANANDAYHQTASSPDGEGPYLAMTKALEVSKLAASDIDYVNVHGTGTENNDLSEGKALERFFHDEMPLFSSTKAFTGHTLGAAGAIEAVLSALSIKNNIVYPNLNFIEKISDLNIIPNIELIKNIDVNNVLSNSFGFGGNDSTLIFSKY